MAICDEEYQEDEKHTGPHYKDSFKNERMQLYDVGMASMHTMDSAALATLAVARLGMGRGRSNAALEADHPPVLLAAGCGLEIVTGLYMGRGLLAR